MELKLIEIGKSRDLDFFFDFSWYQIENAILGRGI